MAVHVVSSPVTTWGYNNNADDWMYNLALVAYYCVSSAQVRGLASCHADCIEWVRVQSYLSTRPMEWIVNVQTLSCSVQNLSRAVTKGMLQGRKWQWLNPPFLMEMTARFCCTSLEMKFDAVDIREMCVRSFCCSTACWDRPSTYYFWKIISFVQFRHHS